MKAAEKREMDKSLEIFRRNLIHVVWAMAVTVAVIDGPSGFFSTLTVNNDRGWTPKLVTAIVDD